MAQNLVINGVTYNGVDSISVPTSSGGEATFSDVSKVETWVFTLDNGTTTEKQVNVG